MAENDCSVRGQLSRELRVELYGLGVGSPRQDFQPYGVQSILSTP